MVSEDFREASGKSNLPSLQSISVLNTPVSAPDSGTCTVMPWTPGDSTRVQHLVGGFPHNSFGSAAAHECPLIKSMIRFALGSTA